MKDPIERQAAIDALGERPSVYFGTAYEIAQRNQYDRDKLAIETVPSAQPEPCEDAVSREAAIDVLKMDTTIIPYKKARQYVDLTIEEISERLKKLPSAQPEQRWILCSERLPEEYGNYLITTHDGNVDIGTIDPKKKGVWSACDADGFYWLREVNAWMPLPEPYREEGDE